MADLIARQGHEVDGNLEAHMADPALPLLDVEAWAGTYAATLEPVLQRMLLAGWREGQRRLAAEQRKALIEGWDVFDPNVLAWAQNYPREFGARVNVAFAKRITQVVATGMSEGQRLSELRARVNEQVFSGTATKAKADTIARTEASRASDRGMEQSWINSGVVEAKVWRTTPMEEWPCEWCLAMEGKIIELGQPYFDQGQELETDAGKLRFDYETVQGPPLHPNCHCTKDPVLIDEEPG